MSDAAAVEPDWALIPGSLCDGCTDWAGDRVSGHCAKVGILPTMARRHADGSIDWCMVLSRSR